MTAPTEDGDLPCHLDEARFFDPSTGEWGYVVICVQPDHAPCPSEREMFRFRDEEGHSTKAKV